MNKILIVIICYLAPLTNLKIGEIQPVELFMLTCVFISLLVFCLKIFAIRSAREVTSLVRGYTWFLVAVTVLALYDARFPYYPPIELSLLNTPPYLSIAKTIELLLVINCLILPLVVFVRYPRLINFCARAYVYSGLINAFYGIASWAALFAGIKLGGAYAIEGPRAKAFFYEGGPLGVYLVSVIMIVLFRKYVLKEGQLLFMKAQLGVLVVAIFAASSKAGILLALVLWLYYTVFIQRKIGKLFLILLIPLPLILLSGKLDGLAGYEHEYTHFSESAAERPHDPALIAGRLMAAILVPRMVADHPVAGVGLGNYSLQRNNPNYLMGLPLLDGWDLPGLGLVGYVAELGIPLFIWLTLLLRKPIKFVKARQVPQFVILLASFQFFAHLLGVQVTFAYPWIVTAMALGYAVNQPMASQKRRGRRILKFFMLDHLLVQRPIRVYSALKGEALTEGGSASVNKDAERIDA